MSIGNRIHYRLQGKIDEFVNNIDETKINFIYGGQTYRDIELRQKEHIAEDIKFKKMDIYEIPNCHTKNPNQSQYVENYLINKLNEKFSIKCINDRNKDGAISQRGGAGENNSNVLHRFYIMYK
jgi:hypothetical protein